MIRQASDEGVTEIIGFVLIMGLVAVVLFIMALVVPPMTGAEMEGELALDAVEDISGLKYDMDLLWEASTPPREASTLPNVTRSVLIQLSTPKRGIVSMLPVFTPTIGSATLTAGVSGISLDVGGTRYDNLLRLSYTTSNNYAPDSMVVYEAGAVFAGTRDLQSLVLAPSVGKSDNSLLIVLPRLVEGGETSVSGNRFGVVEYRLIDTNITGPYSRPEIKININGREDAAKSLANLISDDMELNDQKNTWTLEKYPGTVKVMTVNYSVVMRGAVVMQGAVP